MIKIIKEKKNMCVESREAKKKKKKLARIDSG